MENKLERRLVSPRNRELLQSMTEEIVERMCIMSEGEEKITHEVLAKSMTRAIKNHGVKSNTEDYIVELLPLVDEALKKLEQKRPKEKKEQKKGFSHLVDVYKEIAPNKVTIESLGIVISFRLEKDDRGREQLKEIDRYKLDSRSQGREILRFPDEIYNYICRTARAVLRDRKKQQLKN
jgi:hypothetical protein